MGTLALVQTLSLLQKVSQVKKYLITAGIAFAAGYIAAMTTHLAFSLGLFVIVAVGGYLIYRKTKRQIHGVITQGLALRPAVLRGVRALTSMDDLESTLSWQDVRRPDRVVTRAEVLNEEEPQRRR
jgi:hypothetical protein